MGCMDSVLMPDAEVMLHRENVGKGAIIIAKELDSDTEEIKLDENALCDDSRTEPIIFTTASNDISSISKSQLITQTNYISKQAVQKLLERKDLNADIQHINFKEDKLHRRIQKHTTYKGQPK